MIEGSGSVRLTIGSGSGRPKNIRILRIRIRNTGKRYHLFNHFRHFRHLGQKHSNSSEKQKKKILWMNILDSCGELSKRNRITYDLQLVEWLAEWVGLVLGQELEVRLDGAQEHLRYLHPVPAKKITIKEGLSKDWEGWWLGLFEKWKLRSGLWQGCIFSGY